MKKLLAIAIVGGFLALATGCPPATTSSSVKTTPATPVKVTTTPAVVKDLDKKDDAKKDLDKKDDVKKDLDKKDDAKKDLDKKDDAKKDLDKKDDKNSTAKDTPLKDTPPKNKTHEGKVVKVADGKLTMTAKSDGKEHSHDAKDAKVTIDGKPAKLEDLKEGYAIEVTTDDKDAATKIDAKK